VWKRLSSTDIYAPRRASELRLRDQGARRINAYLLTATQTEFAYYRIMTESVYIESSVISYLVARPSRDVVVSARQAITEIWWREQRLEYELFISNLVVQEIRRGDLEAAEKRLNAVEHIPLLATSPEAEVLAEDFIDKGAIPLNSEEDALHIGIAAAAGIDFLLTWNFRHINNAHTKAAITAVVESHGFVCPILCSPEELGVEI